MTRSVFLAVTGLAVSAIAVLAHTPSQHTPYAGQQSRAVSSLSEQEMQGFLNGRGMGLARAAEFNGYPGPMHVLELESKLGLTADQRDAVEQAFDRMRSKARDLGVRYVAAERAVDQAFQSGAADPALIAERVAEAYRLLGEVRLAHLAAHLEITPLFSDEQRKLYAQLRGYAPSSPAHEHPQRPGVQPQ